MKRLRFNKRAKIILFCLLGVILILGGYIGIDQLVFNTKKAEITAFAEQYATDIASAGSVAKEDYDKGKDWVLENQKQKIMKFLDQYSDQNDNYAYSGVSNCLESLNEKLDDGWKWYDQAVDGIQVVSVKKSPFSNRPSVEVKYHASVYCETGGGLLFEGSSVSPGLSKSGNVHESYYWIRLDLIYDNGWKICRSSLSGSNQPDGINRPT